VDHGQVQEQVTLKKELVMVEKEAVIQAQLMDLRHHPMLHDLHHHLLDLY
jgi:hypothetical protein